VLTSKGDNSAEKFHNPASDFSICVCLQLHLLVINLKGSIYYFINNIWYKYTGITICQIKKTIFNGWQQITNTLKTEDWTTQTPLKFWTDMNSEAPSESAVRFELHKYHFMSKGDGGNHPPHFERLRVTKLIYPPFFLITLKNDIFF
jgi:hypothetical protein